MGREPIDTGQVLDLRVTEAMGMRQVFVANDALFSSRIPVSWEFPSSQAVKTLYSGILQTMWLGQKNKNRLEVSGESEPPGLHCAPTSWLWERPLIHCPTRSAHRREA